MKGKVREGSICVYFSFFQFLQFFSFFFACNASDFIIGSFFSWTLPVLISYSFEKSSCCGYNVSQHNRRIFTFSFCIPTIQYSEHAYIKTECPLRPLRTDKHMWWNQKQKQHNNFNFCKSKNAQFAMDTITGKKNCELWSSNNSDIQTCW